MDNIFLIIALAALVFLAFAVILVAALIRRPRREWQAAVHAQTQDLRSGAVPAKLGAKKTSLDEIWNLYSEAGSAYVGAPRLPDREEVRDRISPATDDDYLQAQSEWGTFPVVPKTPRNFRPVDFSFPGAPRAAAGSVESVPLASAPAAPSLPEVSVPSVSAGPPPPTEEELLAQAASEEVEEALAEEEVLEVDFAPEVAQVFEDARDDVDDSYEDVSVEDVSVEEAPVEVFSEDDRAEALADADFDSDGAGSGAPSEEEEPPAPAPDDLSNWLATVVNTPVPEEGKEWPSRLAIHHTWPEGRSEEDLAGDAEILVEEPPAVEVAFTEGEAADSDGLPAAPEPAILDESAVEDELAIDDALVGDEELPVEEASLSDEPELEHQFTVEEEHFVEVTPSDDEFTDRDMTAEPAGYEPTDGQPTDNELVVEEDLSAEDVILGEDEPSNEGEHSGDALPVGDEVFEEVALTTDATPADEGWADEDSADEEPSTEDSGR